MQLAIGPMSSEIIEASFRYSHFRRKQLMLISSKNQIDHSGGYVNNWTTKQYMEFITELRSKYPNANIKVCRDHCGPGFNGKHDLQDTYQTIESDIKNGFDLIHIDFCHYKGTKKEVFEESKKAILHCFKLNPKIEIEVGTDENTGAEFTVNDLSVLDEEIEFFLSFCKPKFYVVQTSSLVTEINQAGSFNKHFVEKAAALLHRHGVQLKEHNADYLPTNEIDMRRGIVDAMNIAPQLGVVQTMVILKKCLQFGIDYRPFMELVYNGGKWKKWMDQNTEDNKMLCFLIAGHYHFSSQEYKSIISKLEEKEDIKDSIINAIMEVIEHYEHK